MEDVMEAMRKHIRSTAISIVARMEFNCQAPLRRDPPTQRRHQGKWIFKKRKFSDLDIIASISAISSGRYKIDMESVLGVFLYENGHWFI
jgi:hypothetical protein